MGDVGISGLDVSRQREVANLSALLHSALTIGVQTLFRLWTVALGSSVDGSTR